MIAPVAIPRSAFMNPHADLLKGERHEPFAVGDIAR
jgi:hypothetical protein